MQDEPSNSTSHRALSKAFESSAIEAEAPLELLINAKPESGTFVDASKLAVADCRATLFLKKRLIEYYRVSKS